MSNKVINTLKTMYNLSHQKVEDKQKEIAELYKLMSDMEQRFEQLSKSIESQGIPTVLGDDTLLYLSYGNFVERARFEMEDIKEALADAETILHEKQDAIKDLYAEQKRFEILHRRKVQERQDKIAKQTQAELDEMSQYRRQG